MPASVSPRTIKQSSLVAAKNRIRFLLVEKARKNLATVLAKMLSPPQAPNLFSFYVSEIYG